ncbi:hypothetical protein V6N11_017618 [Hibiscus sabdariffa]|uniref:Uncharacterized protein n=1 Tax=Hibiscus sabdariffa TaxID=183260 RepID=A0ABR2TZ20_9ROSI
MVSFSGSRFGFSFQWVAAKLKTGRAGDCMTTLNSQRHKSAASEPFNDTSCISSRLRSQTFFFARLCRQAFFFVPYGVQRLKHA